LLRDPQKRATYDRYGEAGLRGAAAGIPSRGPLGSAEHLHARLRGLRRIGRPVRRPRASGTGPRSGVDVKVTLPLTLLEVATGVDKEIKLKVLDACDRCGGSGAEPGSKSHHCSTCAGHGEVRRAQRSFLWPVRHRRAVPDLQGRGHGHRHAVQEVSWRRTHRADKTIKVSYLLVSPLDST